MPARPTFTAFALLAALWAAPASAGDGDGDGETCLRACVIGRHMPGDVTDDEIRSVMRTCRDQCTARTAAALARSHPGQGPAGCAAEPISLEDYRAIRAASPSFVVQSNVFTWDLHNVLKNRTIREIIVVTQSLDLAEVELTGTTLIPPGETETVLVTGFFDGYPVARYATKVRAILACPAG